MWGEGGTAGYAVYFLGEGGGREVTGFGRRGTGGGVGAASAPAFEGEGFWI